MSAIVSFALDAGWVRLGCRRGEYRALHDGTGEMITLPAVGGADGAEWQLHSTDGFAVLNCAGEVQLASELFSYGFYQSIDEGCEPKLFRQLDESPSEWLDELQCRFISQCFNGTDKRRMASFVAETFHYAVAR